MPAQNQTVPRLTAPSAPGISGLQAFNLALEAIEQAAELELPRETFRTLLSIRGKRIARKEAGLRRLRAA